MKPTWLAALALTTVLATDSPGPVGKELALFTITKSENKNLVQYLIRVDEHCMPVPAAPVVAYWRMLELGPGKTAPLLPREQKAYGLASQTPATPESRGAVAAVRIVLRAVSDRPVLVETSRAADGTCHALSTVRIVGAPAHLDDVYVRLKWPVGVDYLLLQGWSMDGTRRVEEKLPS